MKRRTLAAFDRVAPELEREVGSDLLGSRHGATDSELIFLWLLTRMARVGIELNETCKDHDRLRALLAESVPLLAARSEEAGADERARLNLLLTDGVTLVASRWGAAKFMSLSELKVRVGRKRCSRSLPLGTPACTRPYDHRAEGCPAPV